MGAGRLTIDLGAIADNWRSLDRMSADAVRTGAVVKADAYGLGAGPVSAALAATGVRSFFVALAAEGVALREHLGREPDIYVFSGLMGDDLDAIRTHRLIPLINSPEQARDLCQNLPDHPHGLQVDSGMNRLGIEPEDLGQLPDGLAPRLVMSHLACADEPDHQMNARQLEVFLSIGTHFPDAPRSFAATGGTLLGPEYHFDMTRPGVGLYGGLPFAGARPVVTLTLPVIQTRPVAVGEPVGYGNAWIAERPSTIATIAAGYADGLARALSPAMVAYAGDTPCQVVGRISMDLITVDVTDLDHLPSELTLLNDRQTVDNLADAGGTIGYEVLTSLGQRYSRDYLPA